MYSILVRFHYKRMYTEVIIYGQFCIKKSFSTSYMEYKTWSQSKATYCDMNATTNQACFVCFKGCAHNVHKFGHYRLKTFTTTPGRTLGFSNASLHLTPSIVTWNCLSNSMHNTKNQYTCSAMFSSLDNHTVSFKKSNQWRHKSGWKLLH